MNLDLIRWWTNWMPFEDYELRMRDKIDSDSIDYSEALKPQQFSNCEEQLLSYMPWVGNECKDKHFHFTKSCTDAIDAIFKPYIDDENSLVITTSLEHESVIKNLKKCKNVVTLDAGITTLHNSLIIPEIVKQAGNKLYSKILIYVVGTYVGFGNIHSNYLVEKIQQRARIMSDNVCTVLDDCQGMFLVPRDYSIYDYVLCTSHALTRLDSGIVFSEKDDIGTKALEPATLLTQRLEPVIKRREKLLMFKNVMSQYFDTYRHQFEQIELSNSAPYIFSVDDVNRCISDDFGLELEKYYIMLDGRNSDSDKRILRFRAMHFLFFPQHLIDGLQFFEDFMQEIF